MQRTLYRTQQKMTPILLTGFFLSYVSIDNIFNGPFREFLKNYITLNEFGSNPREEVLYYLILIVGGFQLFTAVQSMFQPILEVSEYKIAMRTSEKLLTVVEDIQDLRKVILEEEYLKLIFDKETYSVLIENTDTDELQSFIDDLNSGNVT
ncbi:MAG: hypothetical protein H8D44_02970 [Actinobacteria bacterium]|jgi:hypothetical protein|nr:hypothetical protein [Actinomycetota bacterium]MDB4823737.1 hypothetical protein [Acidimicrobiia bacterium]